MTIILRVATTDSIVAPLLPKWYDPSTMVISPVVASSRNMALESDR